MARIGSTASREELASDLNNAPMNLPDDKDSHAAIDRQLMRTIQLGDLYLQRRMSMSIY